MNTTIKGMLETMKPKISTLSEREKMLYEAGIGLLGIFVCEDFFNIPKLPQDKYSTDGLFYTIPYYDDDQLWAIDNKRILLVVYKIENRSFCCPLRIDCDIEDKKNFKILVYDQSGERTSILELVSCENGTYTIQIANNSTLKLTDLITANPSVLN